MKNTTDEFACCENPGMSQREFLLVLASKKAMIPLILPAVAVIACTVSGFMLDMRLIIVALMILLLIIPMLIFFLYFAYALSPRAVHCVRPHKLHFSPRGITIRYRVSAPTQEDPDATREVISEWQKSDISSFSIGLERLLIFSDKPFGIVSVPYAECTQTERIIKWLREP